MASRRDRCRDDPEDEAKRTRAPARRFRDFRYATLDSWSRRRRAVGKAEWTHGKADPRFVVTSLSKAKVDTRDLYERLYCARGEMENRLKECQGELFADRTSTATMGAQSTAPVVRLFCLRAEVRAAPHGLPHTEFATATCGTIRLRLLKIGALVNERAPHQDRHGLGLLGRAGVASRSRPPPSRARLAGLTRAAAPCHEPRNLGPPEPRCRHQNTLDALTAPRSRSTSAPNALAIHSSK